MSDSLILPFKPFTLDEVAKITGVSPHILDAWAGLDKCLPLKSGCGEVGLDYMQTFAVFVGWEYLREGAEPYRAKAAVAALAAISKDMMLQEFLQGHSFLALSQHTGLRGHMFVKAPNSVIGWRLDCKRLWNVFEQSLVKVFPDYKPSGIGVAG